MVNFKAKFPKMVVQMKQYQNCTLQGINRIQRLKMVQKEPNLCRMRVKNTKSSILRPICHLEHCKSRNGQKELLHKGHDTKTVRNETQVCGRGSESFKKGQIVGKIEVQNTKSSILRPICHLEHCKSITGQNKWLYKRNNVKKCTL